MSENIEKALKAYDDKNFKEAFKYFKLEKDKANVQGFDEKYSFKFIKTIYDSVIKEIKVIDNESKRWIVYIITHLKKNDVFYKITIFKVVELLLKKQNPEYNKIIVWLQKLELQFLTDEQKYFEKDGKKISLSSEKEKYYMYLSKVYEKLKNYKKSSEISVEALENLKDFTNDSDIWFKRRIAEWKISNKDFDDALSIYREIQKRKNDWFILKEIGVIYFQKSEFEKGKNYFLDAICAYGEINKKVNLFLDLYRYLKDYEKKIALTSLKIYFRIKLEEQWNITQKDEEIANLEKIVLSKDELVKISIKKFMERCKELRWKNESSYIGKVENIKDKFFFLKTQNGERYYCKMRDYPSKKKPIEGIVLRFNLVETFDNKKNKYGFSAVNLRFENTEQMI